MAEKRANPIMEHLNIGEFNGGQSSRFQRELVAAARPAFIQKNGKTVEVVMSNRHYDRLIEGGIDINEH